MNLVPKFIYYIDKIFPKDENTIVYNSFPDLSDNSFAFFVYIANHYKNFQHIWLVDSLKKKDIYEKMIKSYVKNDISYKIVRKKSLEGIYWYLTSKYVFFTHGFFSKVKIPKKHYVINLWHGMPLKRVGYLDPKFKGPIQTFTYIIATSPIFQEVLSKAFQVPKEKVLIVGQPRNDLLFNSNKTILENFGINSNNYNKIFMWMPTYRKSIIGDIRIDGNYKNNFPVLSLDDLQEVNSVLKKIDSYLIIKIHPMDHLTNKTFNSFSNIRIIKNEDLEKQSIQLYSLLGVIDVLLTDYSSVYIDFLLTGKPLGFVIEDLEEFKKTRGFIFDNPLNFMPGKVINNKNQFIKFLENPQKSDNYDEINSQLNSIQKNASKLLFKNLRLLNSANSIIL